MLIRILEICSNDAYYHNRPERFIGKCGVVTVLNTRPDGTASCVAWVPLSKKITDQSFVCFYSFKYEIVKRGKKCSK